MTEDQLIRRWFLVGIIYGAPFWLWLGFTLGVNQ